jgi:hypothetical protein
VEFGADLSIALLSNLAGGGCDRDFPADSAFARHEGTRKHRDRWHRLQHTRSRTREHAVVRKRCVRQPANFLPSISIITQLRTRNSHWVARQNRTVTKPTWLSAASLGVALTAPAPMMHLARPSKLRHKAAI